MSEAEFDLLLDVVRSAIAVPGEDVMLATLPLFNAPRKPAAANDNQTDDGRADARTPWALIPFPAGWYAAC